MVLHVAIRAGRRLITPLLLLGVLLQSAEAVACQSSGANRVVIAAGSNVVMTTPYSSTAPADQVQTFTVTINNPHNSKSCNFALSFTRATLPATMSNGVSSLQYTIETTSGAATLLQTTGFVFNSSPAAANRLAGFVAANSSISLTVRARIPAGQTGLTGGTYSDSTARIGIYEISGTLPIALVEETTFAISATVATTCQIGAPSLSSLNFTAAIANGTPNASFVLTSSFTNVSCTQPSRLRLNGSAMQLTPISAASGLDNFIHWRAQGTFSAATATLSTNSAATVISSATNVASGATSGATITINVNLIAGQPLLAGTYTGVLTVTVDPNP